jgi:hypothetical protein
MIRDRLPAVQPDRSLEQEESRAQAAPSAQVNEALRLRTIAYQRSNPNKQP